MFLLILLVSFFAALLSSMSGAGAAMIAIPAWIMLGFPLPVALTACQINAALWTPVAARNYLRGHAWDWRLAFGLIVFGLAGAFIGTRVVLQSDAQFLQRIFGVLILLLVCLAAAHKQFGLQQRAPAIGRVITSVLALPLGFYEAFFGAGNGIFTSAMLTKARGFDLPTALGYYYVIAFVWCAFAAFLYLAGDNGDLSLIIPSSLGAVVGASLGSSIGRKRGAGFVRIVFISLGGILGLKLALGY